MERIQIRCKYALGDVVVLTAAVRDLARSFPGRFRISVATGSADVWLHNPYVEQHASPGRIIDCNRLAVDRVGTGNHYIQACLEMLNERLGTNAQLSALKGDIHLSELEKSWYSEVWNLCGREIPYWLICPGGKFDLPIKWWDHQRYQRVVDALRGRVQFVQVGQWGNHHPALDGVIDLRGKTSLRDLIHLVHHADGVLCGVTSLMHLAAAVPTRGRERSAIIVAGDREPREWEAYPGHVYLTAGERMDCRHCWNQRVNPAGIPKNGVCHRVRNGLPECLDRISAERVIEAFETLHREERVRFLGDRQFTFARRAVRRADRENAFDRHNIHAANAPQKAADFLETIPAYPSGKFNGRGIVICAGGVGYFAQAWVCLRMLRQLGCNLPAEVWHLGPAELDARMARLLASVNAESVDARERMKTAPMRNPLGWELKCYAVLHSKFREVLSLDADNVATVDPTFLFETPEYLRTGAIFWPDYKRLDRRRAIWKLCGVQYRDEPEFESGQMVIHKERCWRALNLAWWYNDHSEFFYRHIHGDKDTFHLAWRRAGTDYAMPPYPIESLQGVMCQHDFQGRRIFQHRNSHKWSFFGENKRIEGFLLEEDCLAHLDELRRLWDGKINGERESRQEQPGTFRVGTIDREVFQGVAVQNEYQLPERFLPRDVILDVGAHIGSFVRACHDRGSREIHAYEPHAENFEMARRNVGRLAGVHLHAGAVLDSAGFAKVGPFPRDPGKENTGGAIVTKSTDGIAAFGINELLQRLGYVTLLKLDCEGSEWPILGALTEWDRIAAICGEYHGKNFDPVVKLTELLHPRFSHVRIETPNEEGLGKFWASHIKGGFSNAHVRHKRVPAPASGL